MPRDARIIPPRGYLHVISRGNNKRNLFFRPGDYRIYCALVCRLKKEELIRVVHYCLMPNHVHFLVGIDEQSDLSNFMKRLNLKYFYHYRKKRTYVGHLWQDRFKSKLIDNDAYFIQCGKYIELNPVRGGMVKAPEDYEFSSYGHYAFGHPSRIIDEDLFYHELGQTPQQRQCAYRKMLINEIVPEKIVLHIKWL